jgi:transposase-like protein
MPKFDMFAPCPACGAAWAYEQNDVMYSRCIGIEVQGGYDGVSYWRCPDCGAEWDRFTGERR